MIMKENISAIIKKRLLKIYGEKISDEDIRDILGLIREYESGQPSGKLWDEKDVILITYGDSVRESKDAPLKTLKKFLVNYLEKEISVVHILPFFPYSSDDGFSVIDYLEVDPELGTWDDISSLGNKFDLMYDLVINHISSESEWFRNYLEGKDPGAGYFIEVDPDADLSEVVRPRSTPLLTAFDTARGKKHLWTTFSEDQIDLDFSNVDVLKEMITILLEYIKKGARIIRLDAIAFLWKEIGTDCLHLPETHEMVKLLRDIAGNIRPGVIIITETNVPNEENLSYFGDGDEAHMIYQFSLPPLLLHGLFAGTSKYLNQWAGSMPQPPDGCTYFNFTASHDGIGVRPLEGLLPEEEKEKLYNAIKASGGKISTRRKSDGSDSPYELNITYYDAMKRTLDGEDEHQAGRFLASQTLMLTLQGIPAFYIHSLLSTENYYEGVEETGRARTINRKKWDYHEVTVSFAGDETREYLFEEMKRRIRLRKELPVLHPDNPQEIIRAGEEVFVVRRFSDDGDELVSITNLTNEKITVEWNKVLGHEGDVMDLIHSYLCKAKEPIDLEPYQVVWLVREDKA